MKKLLALVVCLCLLAPCASALDLDLSSMSFDDLKQLQNEINSEIITRPEWKETKIPTGIWKVGEDIPEGSYSIELLNEELGCLIIVWGYAKEDYSTNGGMIFCEQAYADAPIGKIELLSGYIVEILGPAVFKPVKGLDF